MDLNQRLSNVTDLNNEHVDVTPLKDSPYIPNQQVAFINHRITYKIFSKHLILLLKHMDYHLKTLFLIHRK